MSDSKPRVVSAWGAVWRGLLFLAVVFALFDLSSTYLRYHDIQRAAPNGLAALLASNAVANRMIVEALMWLVVIGALYGLCRLTPARDHPATKPADEAPHSKPRGSGPWRSGPPSS